MFAAEFAHCRKAWLKVLDKVLETPLCIVLEIAAFLGGYGSATMGTLQFAFDVCLDLAMGGDGREAQGMR
jgi:hypothetical protein